MKITCQAPAKIILSGEHSVIYGAPCLSMAVNLPTECEIIFTENNLGFVEIELVDYHQKHAFPFKTWRKLALNIETRFQLYLQNINAIQTVLQHPVDLILVTLQHFHQTIGLKQGHWSIKFKSHHLPSRGLGSSAAVIVSLLSGLYKAHNFIDYQDHILSLAQSIEARQHGKSSGTDPTTILLGGLLHYQAHEKTIKLKTHYFQAWLIDTGIPQSSTGKSVAKVAESFGQQHPIWSKFATTTLKMESAWKQENSSKLRSAIRSNQKLLEKIGVVPKKVSHFIQALQLSDKTAAKICGAGSVSGDAAGIVLCVSPNVPKKLCDDYGYEAFPLEFQKQGASCEVDF